jgi:histidinol-phosphate aminotransferase
VRRSVLCLEAYVPPLAGRAGSLRLDFNENTVGCSPAARAAVARLSRELLATYPEYDAARRRLARHFGVRPVELVLTAGVDDGLRLVVDTFVDPGSTVLLVEPTFPMYRFYAARAGARIRALRYDRWMRFPLAAVLRALAAAPRVFLLANPNNPTGTVVSAADLRQILRAARRTWVVVDEAYFEFCGITALGWIRRHPNLLVARTFSKAMGLAGLRLGCLFGSQRAAALLQRAQSPYPVTTPALVGALAAISDGAGQRQYLAQIARGKELLLKGLERLGIPNFPSGANFVLADLGPRAPRVLRALRHRRILLRDRQSDFGRIGFVRITLGTPAQMRRLLATLKEVW